MTVVTVAVGFNLQISGNTEEDSGNESDTGNDEGVEHDLVVLTKVIIGFMDNDTNDAVTNGTPQTLTTEHFLAELRVRGQFAHDHGVQERESTSSEEEAGSIDAKVVSELVNSLFRFQEDGEEKETHAAAVSGNTSSDN